ncbi:MAG TPA: peptide MFS transporter [Vitreimonas sp.]|uniref:peptide MFS transporter n=1 Tax=Vitreimonas sp. TaxID=3069702 RepID=UPI002D556BB3|nr:peptide MFS transporter [Vitreimonas sp.]HYD87270.1 peptide MFS transporter [Vitreimonas sp.]
MTDATAGAPQGSDEQTFLGHPRGLVTLFFTEMWERFSFYGMRALLVIYLTQHFLFSQNDAQGLYGAYAALVYLIPVIGGVIADRFLGARKAVTIGAALLVLGHFGMAFEGSGSRQYLEAGGESYLVSAEGRGAGRVAHIDLPEGRAQLRFDVREYADLVAQDMPVRRLEGDAYSLTSEAPSFVYSLCSMVGLPCGEPPATSLNIEGEGAYPIRVEGEMSVVDINGTTYQLEQTSLRDAVAFDPGATDSADDDRTIRTFADGSYSDRVQQEQLYVQILYLSLALIIIGVGFLKANISTTVGALYAPDDPRRDGGFTIFYMGINLGAFLATLACGYLGQTYGWKYGFGLAGVGMLFGLTQYLFGQKYLKGKADPPKPIGKLTEGVFWILGLVAVIPAWMLVQQSELMEDALRIVVPALFLLVLGYALIGFKGVERTKMVAALILIFFSVVFWMLFEQAGSSLSLYAENSTNLTVAAPGSIGHTITTYALFAVAILGAIMVLVSIVSFLQKKIDGVMLGYGVVFFALLGGAAGYIAYTTGLGGEVFEMTAAQTQSFNAGYIVLLALPFSAMWLWLARHKLEPSTPVKFSLGLIQVGLGFFVLVWGTQFAGPDFRVPLIFLALLYLLHTTGELFLSPVGLSMVTKLSAARVVGLMMGVWFLSSSLAHILAAIIAQQTASDTIAGVVVNPAAQLQAYVSVFTAVGILGVATGVVLLLISPLLKKWMADVH